MANVQDILRDSRELMAKLASSKAQYSKRAIDGTDPASLPGAENDKPIPEGATAPNPEVADGSQGPASAYSAEGGGDDSDVTRGHATETGEGAIPVEEKPMVTDEADAKVAKMANDILASIRSIQTAKPAVAAKPVAKTAAAKVAPAKVAPAKTDAPKVAGAPKVADALKLELTEGVLAKMAAIALSYDEGVEVMTRILEKQAGAEAAQEVINFLETQNAAAEKQAAEAQGYRDGIEYMQKLAYGAGVQDTLTRLGIDVSALTKAGQELGAEALGGAMGAIPTDMPADVPGAEAAVGAMTADPVAAGMDPAAVADGQDYTIEDVIAALDVLVTNGTITAEEAQEVISNLGGGEAAPEAMPEEAPAEERAEEPAEEPAKEPAEESAPAAE